MAALVLATIIAIGTFIDYLYGRYQYVASSALDYLIIIVIALCVSFLVFLRLARGSSDWFGVIRRVSTYNALLMTTLLTLLVSGVTLRLCNGAFDTQAPGDYRTRIVEVRCGRSSTLKVTGAPLLPTAGDVMSISSYPFDGLDRCQLRPGAHLLLSVGPGFLGRPWISHVQLVN